MSATATTFFHENRIEAAHESRSRRAILLGFGAMLSLMVILLVVAGVELRKMDQRVEAVADHGLKRIALIQDMHKAARARALLMVTIVNDEDPFVRDENVLRYDRLGGQFAVAREKLTGMILDEEEKRLLAKNADAVGRSQGELRKVIDAALKEQPAMARLLLVRDAIPMQESMLAVLTELTNYVTDRARGESQQARIAYSRTRWVLVGGGIAIVISGVVIAWWVRRRMNILKKERVTLTRALQESLRDVTFQKQAMDEHAIVSIADVDGNIAYANDKFCQVSGYARDDLLGKNHRILKSGAHPDSLYKEMWETIASGRVWHGEVCNRTMNGRLYWVKTTIVPFLDDHGLPYQYISIRTDITGVKEIESLLRKSKADLEQRVAARTTELRDQLRFTTELMEALPNPIYYTNREGIFQGVNKAWEALFGMTRERIVGYRLDALYRQAPEVVARHTDMDEALWRNGGTQSYEIDIPAANGETRDVVFYKAALSNAEGNITGLIGAIVDMTERRKTEKALNQFKDTLDQTRDCVFMFWPDTLMFFYVNRGAVKQVGYSGDELMNMTPLDIKPEFSEQKFRELLRPLITGETPALTFETVHRHKDGHDTPVRLVLQYVQTMDTPRFVAIGRDITERRLAEVQLKQRFEEVNALNGKLQQAQQQLLQSEKMASIGQLAAGVAHEINNPIGYVFSNLGTLEHYLHDLLQVIAAYEATEVHLAEEAARAAVKQAREKADLAYLKEDIEPLMGECREGITRVRKIVQDLKDFSHVDSNLEWQWTNLHHGIDSTLNIVNNEIKYKADVVKEYGNLPEVECLPSQLNQVVMNLLVNAAHAMKDERGKITVRTACEGDNVWIEVSDTGGGIPKENLTRIFDPFFTTKPVGKGTGLGLSLSYGIVQKHNGRIEVQSEPGKGTTFRITLPVRHVETGNNVKVKA